MRNSLLALAFAAFALSAIEAGAAIPSTSTRNESRSGATIEELKEALQLPLMERLSRIEQMGPKGYKALVKLMFNESESMDVRWKAVTAVGRIGGADARPEVLRALRHQDWYMRNAGLLAMRGIDRAEAAKWARQMLSDKALVVRAAAVDMIEDLADREGATLLWSKINAKENFKGGQSLYVRRRMAEVLAKIDGRSGNEARFVALLDDKDETLHESAVRALERITRQTLGEADAPIEDRRAEWLAWWKNRRG